MAARAGAMIADPEFVQFHPTAIDVGRDPAPLATEALRGEGAILVNDRGERFMLAVHKDAELAPRDVVARGIFREIRAGRKTFLDTRQAIGAKFPEAFPTVFAYCMIRGHRSAHQSSIPVAPAAHYHMGGIAVDETRAHEPCPASGPSANAPRPARTAPTASPRTRCSKPSSSARAPQPTSTRHRHRRQQAATAMPPPAIIDAPPTALAIATLRHAMTMNVGLERNASDLVAALATIAHLEKADAGDPDLRNMTATATLIAAAALNRTESRGGHFRSDYPQADPA